MVLGNCAGAFLPAGNSEHLDVAAAFAEVSEVVSLGSLPMAVVTATTRTLPAGLAAAEVARLTEAWNQGQQDWMALSAAAVGGGAYFLTTSARLALAPNRRAAMVNFHASLIQLTLLLVAAIADAALHA